MFAIGAQDTGFALLVMTQSALDN